MTKHLLRKNSLQRKQPNNSFHKERAAGYCELQYPAALSFQNEIGAKTILTESAEGDTMRCKTGRFYLLFFRFSYILENSAK